MTPTASSKTDWPVVWRDKRTGTMRKTVRRTKLGAETVARERRAAGHTDVRVQS